MLRLNRNPMIHRFLLPAIAFAISTTPLMAQGIKTLKERYHEQQDMPYIPNAYNNQRVSPAYRFQSPANRAMTNSTIFTTQVNVNASGQNILGDAANEPSIAVNPLNPSQMVIGWRQFDNVSSNFRQAGWAFSTDAGQTWTFPGVIEPTIFRSDPVLDCDDDGNFYYNSLTNSPTYMCKVFRSNNGGQNWDAGVDAQGGDKQWMVIDRTPGVGNDHIYSFWTSYYSYCTPDNFTRSTNSGNSYEPCSFVDNDPYYGNMAVGRNGELFIGSGGLTYDSLSIARSTNAQISGSSIAWDLTVSVFMDGNLDGWNQVNPQGLLGQANVDVDRSNGAGQDNVYLAASVLRNSNWDPGDVMFARSTDGGMTWDPPVQINDDASAYNTQWFTTMSVAPNGRIDVIWLDTREDLWGLDSSALYYSYSLDMGNTWSVNEKLSPLFDPHVGYPQQMKMGDYFDMESDSIGVHLTWANTLNGEQDVYYSRIIPPISVGLNHSPANQSMFSVFPNPGNGLYYISGPASRRHVEVISMRGEKLLDTEQESVITVIDLVNQPSGVYHLKITLPGQPPAVYKLIR